MRYELLNVAADFLFRQFFQRRQVDLLDQPAMQANFGVKELVGQQRITGGGRNGLGAASGNTVRDTSSCAVFSAIAAMFGVAMRRVEKRPAILIS